ncbi:hypothetical protein [Streptomyces sp. NPDC048606]|uniref:hypothetical protein n=1 Tax=Streptomyces sp. NPDC048606 TaxID=3154726 RepID=UPI00341D4784
MSQAEEAHVTGHPTGRTVRRRGVADHLRTVVRGTNLLPAFMVLTIMMVALWLMGMPFLQALTISTGVKIAVALCELRRPPASPED